MKYIFHRRFRGTAICGTINLPALTICELHNGCLCCGEKPLFFPTSENAHQYTARDDDGNGLLRGTMTQAIQKELAKRDGRHQERLDRVWKDSICRNYQRKQSDCWLWSHEFYNAPIEDLRHISELVGAKEE